MTIRHRPLHAALLPIAMIAFAGCTTAPPVPPVTTDCNANAVQPYIGLAASEDVIEASRKASGAELVRPIRPGQAVTMDFRGNRLNLYLDTSGAITRASCG